MRGGIVDLGIDQIRLPVRAINFAFAPLRFRIAPMDFLSPRGKSIFVIDDGSGERNDDAMRGDPEGATDV
jgi:hypothetical protein